MNVRGGDYFLEEPYAEQEKRFSEFINRNARAGKKMLFIEMGAGYSKSNLI